jgi:hypothetical protein
MPIALGVNEVKLKNSGFNENAIIRLAAGTYSTSSNSDIIQISVTSSSYMTDYSTEDYDTIQEMNAKDEGCIIVMKYTGLSKNEVGCASFNGEWVNENCKVISTSEDTVEISVTKSGTYKVVKADNENESNILPNLYLVISLIIACALAMPFMVYVDKNTLYINIPSQSATSRSGLDGKFSSEYGGEYSEDSIFSKHLLISMFINTHDIPRSEKLLTILTNVVFGIFIQSAMFEHLNIYEAFIGMISALIVLPLSVTIITLLRFRTSKLAKIIGIALAAIIMSFSVVGVYMLGSMSLWYIAFVCGLGTEFVVSQSIIMGLRKFFNF